MQTLKGPQAFHIRITDGINSIVKSFLRTEARAGAGSYLLLAVSAEQNDKDQQEDDAHAHNEQGEVGHQCHNQEHRPHLGC